MSGVFAFLLLLFPSLVSGLATVSDGADIARARLLQAISSPAAKLTISPELVIPEPSDSTAILLQSNAIGTLAEQIRQCKANSAWISGSVSALQTFCREQENALGAFPGPLPVVYCGNEEIEVADLSNAGVSGLLVRVLGGEGVKSVEELNADDKWVGHCKSALESGMQPIPEVTLDFAAAPSWTESDMDLLVEKIASMVEYEPAAVLLTISPAPESDEAGTTEEEALPLPTVPKSLGRRVPILGSVRVPAGESRLSNEVGRFKAAGFTGVVVRSDCIPGFRMNPDLEIVGRFWSSCIGELKSTRSKSFNFNSRNNMETNQMTKWANYQQNVMDSGALGDPDDSHSIVDSAAGEYKGFV